MTLPSNVQTITVTGKLLDPAGNPIMGSVTFAPPVAVQDIGGPATFAVYPVTVSMGNAGFSVVLPCTDDPHLSPTGWGYTVQFNFTQGQVGIPGGFGYQNVAIPRSLGASVDISAVLPPSQAPAGAGNTYGLLAGNNTWSGSNTFTGTVAGNGISAWFNVKAYGAVGNGTTDDTTAIQAAINAAHAASPTGGVVYLPTGTYKVTSALTAYSHITLLGDGAQVSQITMATTNTNIVSGVDLSYVTIQDLWLEGTSGGTGKGISFTLSSNPATTYLSFNRVTVADCGGNGIDIANPIASVLNRVNAQTCGGDGFSIHGVVSGAAGTSTSFVGCYAIANTGNGFNIYNMTGVSMTGIASDNHTTSGKAAVLIDTCNGVTINGADIENNAIGIKVTGGKSNSIAGYYNYAQPSGGVGLYATGSTTDLVVVGAVEASPNAGATAWVKTDAGTNVTLLSSNHSTANALTAATTRLQVLDSTLQFVKSGASTVTIDNFGGTAVFNANVALPTGGTVRVPTGTNAAQGTVTVNGTTPVTVTTTAASANVNVYFSLKTPGGTPGVPYVSTMTAGTSFAVTSTAGDTSVWNWYMVGTV